MTDNIEELRKAFGMNGDSQGGGSEKFGTLLNFGCFEGQFYKRMDGNKVPLVNNQAPNKLIVDFYNMQVGPCNLSIPTFNYKHWNDTIPVLPNEDNWKMQFDVNVWSPKIGFCHYSSNSKLCNDSIVETLTNYIREYHPKYDQSKVASCAISVEQIVINKRTLYFPTFKILGYIDRSQTELPDIDLFVTPETKPKSNGQAKQADVPSVEEFNDSLDVLDIDTPEPTETTPKDNNDGW